MARCVVVLLGVTALCSQALLPLSIGEAINVVAGRLDQDQIKHGLMGGTRLEEADFAGSIAVGMMCAHRVPCDGRFPQSR